MRRPWLPAFVLAQAALLSPSLLAQEVAFSAFEGLAVSTADRTDVSRLTDGGVIAVGGSSAIVVTIAGELRGRADRDGVVGALLVPDLPFFTSANRLRKSLSFAAESAASVSAGESSYFVSKSKRIEVAFPAYHLYLFNTSGASATVNVYVYPSRT